MTPPFHPLMVLHPFINFLSSYLFIFLHIFYPVISLIKTPPVTALLLTLPLTYKFLHKVAKTITNSWIWMYMTNFDMGINLTFSHYSAASTMTILCMLWFITKNLPQLANTYLNSSTNHKPYLNLLLTVFIITMTDMLQFLVKYKEQTSMLTIFID